MNDILAIISLLAGIASIVLAIIAIWLALYSKSETDKTNQKTQDLLIDIRSDAKTISQVAMPELKAYGDSVRRYIFQSNGTKSDINKIEFEESVNASMDDIKNEIIELKNSNDLNGLKKRLENIEKQVEKSASTIKKSISFSVETGNKSKIVIYARNNEYEFDPVRSKWDEAIKRLLNDLNLSGKEYGEWLLINERTAAPVTKEFLFDSNMPIDKILRGGDKLYFKTQEDFLKHRHTL